MRTRTFKKIGLSFLLVAFGLTLVGCSGSASEKAYYAGPNGLDITLQGAMESQSRIIITTANETLVVTMAWSDTASWYYDVPEEQPEYVIAQYAAGSSSITYIQIHRWISKKPADFGK